jgi:hypothetical protein
MEWFKLKKKTEDGRFPFVMKKKHAAEPGRGWLSEAEAQGLKKRVKRKVLEKKKSKIKPSYWNSGFLEDKIRDNKLTFRKEWIPGDEYSSEADRLQLELIWQDGGGAGIIVENESTLDKVVESPFEITQRTNKLNVVVPAIYFTMDDIGVLKYGLNIFAERHENSSDPAPITGITNAEGSAIGVYISMRDKQKRWEWHFRYASDKNGEGSDYEGYLNSAPITDKYFKTLIELRAKMIAEDPTHAFNIHIRTQTNDYEGYGEEKNSKVRVAYEFRHQGSPKPFQYTELALGSDFNQIRDYEQDQFFAEWILGWNAGKNLQVQFGMKHPMNELDTEMYDYQRFFMRTFIAF